MIWRYWSTKGNLLTLYFRHSIGGILDRLSRKIFALQQDLTFSLLLIQLEKVPQQPAASYLLLQAI